MDRRWKLYICLGLAVLTALLLIGTVVCLTIPWKVVAPGRFTVVVILGCTTLVSAIAVGVMTYLFRPLEIWKNIMEARSMQEQVNVLKRRPQWIAQEPAGLQEELRRLFPISQDTPEGWICSSWNDDMMETKIFYEEAEQQ